MTGTEDCLNLAVFTPVTTNHQRLLPVMVFIHGGGFSRGSYTALGGNYLLDHDIVLVNIHYRLSSLGFGFCVNTSQSRSNVGLLDQLMALQWVSLCCDGAQSDQFDQCWSLGPGPHTLVWRRPGPGDCDG